MEQIVEFGIHPDVRGWRGPQTKLALRVAP
jgi:hypothetical protein